MLTGPYWQARCVGQAWPGFGDPASPTLVLKCLGEALQHDEERGGEHAARLLEAWLGLGEEVYSHQAALAAALSASPLTDLSDAVKSANLLRCLADALLASSARRRKQAAVLLEVWLGIPESSYLDRIALETALRASPIGQVNLPWTWAARLDRAPAGQPPV